MGNTPLIAAHRGSYSGNIPCNSESAFLAALNQGADIIELDVSVTLDGRLFVFHPFKEHAFLRNPIPLRFLPSGLIKNKLFLNQDRVKTQEKILTLDDALELLKGKCKINVDKFWTAPEKIADTIRRHGMQEQVFIKTHPKPRQIDAVEKYAPDLPYFVMVWEKDEISDSLLKRNLRFAGIEALFTCDTQPIAQREYIDSMHKKGLMVWGNAIVYDYREVISGGHNDTVALRGDPEAGWGWFRDMGFDIVQTDFVPSLVQYYQKGI